MDRFKQQLREDESGSDYKALNRFGYIGAYQMGILALKDVGMINKHAKNANRELLKARNWTGKHKVRSSRDFMNNPKIQERIAFEWLGLLYRQLEANGCIKTIGKKYYGVIITEPGLLASAHLLGAAKVCKGIRLNKDYFDGNGTKLSTRLKRYDHFEES